MHYILVGIFLKYIDLKQIVEYLSIYRKVDLFFQRRRRNDNGSMDAEICEFALSGNTSANEMDWQQRGKAECSGRL